MSVTKNYGHTYQTPSFFPTEDSENFQSITSVPINNEEFTIGDKKLRLVNHLLRVPNGLSIKDVQKKPKIFKPNMHNQECRS